MEEGIMTTVIGMGVVFIVLIILSLLIGWLNSGVEAMMGKKPKQQEKAAVPVMPEKAPEESAAKKVEGISPAVVAAITASICILTGKSSEEFKFTKIRRISEVKPVWSMVGTQDIMLTRQRFIERGNK